MKQAILFSGIVLLLLEYKNSSNNIVQLQHRIDSLQKKIDDAYKPGLGEFMSGIQVHHAKLWFAGKNNNWKLADFEIHEIMEAVEDIQHYAADREEVKELPMLQPALDSINDAINKKDKNLFSKYFILLNNTCNNCHRAVHYEFNMVKIPERAPYSNQEFELQNDTTKN
ncbi:MAG TPA: hypothetical protein VN958_06735 [Chitinophagaceae bacterium]|nr:hypothetical protein [Chitinophagaceae bacterium]